MKTYETRLVLLSPPRTGSTAVARLLWRHETINYHCHEPFEASYWSDQGPESVEACLLNPMEIDSGVRVPHTQVAPGSGLLIKDMTFQIDSGHLDFLHRLATAQMIFVMSDPRLATTSRLRIVRELYGADSFPANESGWRSLVQHVEHCRLQGIPYVVVDSDDLRLDPAGVSAALLEVLGLPSQAGLEAWSPRPGLQLCSPEVGALMSEARRTDDPFYRRVLGSAGIQPRVDVDWEREAGLIAAAGLSEHVNGWLRDYATLRTDPALVTVRGANPNQNLDS